MHYPTQDKYPTSSTPHPHTPSQLGVWSNIHGQKRIGNIVVFCLIPFPSKNKVEPNRAKASSIKNGCRKCELMHEHCPKHLCMKSVRQIDMGKWHAENNESV